jgi:hypothetical protein
MKKMLENKIVPPNQLLLMNNINQINRFNQTIMRSLPTFCSFIHRSIDIGRVNLNGGIKIKQSQLYLLKVNTQYLKLKK